MTYKDTAASQRARLRVWRNPQVSCALSPMRVTQLSLPRDKNAVQCVMSLPREAPKRLGTQGFPGDWSHGTSAWHASAFQSPSRKAGAQRRPNYSGAAMVQGTAFQLGKGGDTPVPKCQPSASLASRPVCVWQSRAWRLLLSSQTALAFPRKLNIY